MPVEAITKKTPEEWLASTESELKRGRLKIFLGYAPGVGTTYSMLSEGIRRRGRGEDLDGSSIPAAAAEFASQHHVTQMIFADQR